VPREAKFSLHKLMWSVMKNRVKLDHLYCNELMTKLVCFVAMQIYI